MTDGNSDASGRLLEVVPTTEGPIRQVPPISPAPRIAVAPAVAKAPSFGAAAILKGLANLVFMALVIYVTYIFTQYVSNRPSGPAPIPESDRVAAKKIEELRADERRLLTTYGPPNPLTGAVRIPIERAMELVAAEAAAPAAAPVAMPAPTSPAPATAPAATSVAAAPAGVARSPAAGPSTAAAVPVATAAAPAQPAPAPAVVKRAGMAPEQLYRAICIACHDVDGKGGIVRVAMPVIPNFTDPKWQATRTDAELENSILNGKNQLMLPMRDKLALGHIDAKEMVAFIRSFKGGQTGALVAAPAAAPTAPAAGTPAPAAPATSSGLAAPVALSSPAAPATVPSTALTAPAAAVAPALATAPSPSMAATTIAAAAPTTTTPSAIPASLPAASTPMAVNLSGASPAAKSPAVRAAGEFFMTNCFACHGADGRGTAVRPVMPPIPDFTSRDWQMSHESPLLAVSILDGKGVFMPPWRSKVSPELAENLVAFIRGFGPADLAASTATATAFGTRIRQLRQRWQDLDRQAQTLSGP